MKFNQSCFIRKNTPELRKYLNNLGYEKYPFRTLKDSDYLYANNFDIKYFNGKSAVKGFIPNYFTIDKTNIEDGFDYGVDCGTNEELFKAIAALRDDSDDKQLFTDGKGYWQTCVGSFKYKDMPFFKLHKATLEELINYFK